MEKQIKTKCLSYLEDNKKYHGIIEKVVQEGASNAITYAKQKLIDITYLKNNNIVKESPDGKITILDKLPNNSRVVKVGTKTKLF